MDEGSFVLDPPSFGLNMDLEADMSSTDDLLYYLTDPQSQIMDTTVGGAFDAAAHLLFDGDLALPHAPVLSSFSSSPASSPPSVSSSSFSFSSSPVSSPSSAAYSNSSSSEASPANSQSAGSSDDGDHFVFGTWLESALDTTISPAQLQLSSSADTVSTVNMLEIQPLSTLPQLEILPPSASDDSDAGESKPVAKQETRKRKRTKKSGDETPPQTAVTLPRDELLKLSSQELEDYAENLRKVRKLTAEEEKDLRRQRRLIKNRESAQLSRVRRREHIEVIEQQLHEVQAENARLKLQVESLTTENLQLKQHIASSSSATTTLMPASPLVNTNISADASTAAAAAAGEQVSASLINMVQGWTTLGKGATANAVKATYLFVILLSIGLFFNARFVHYGPGLGPLEMGPRAIMPQPFVYQPASSIDAFGHTESIKQSAAGGHVPLKPGRRLLQHDELPSHHYRHQEPLNAELDDKLAAAGSLKRKTHMNSWQKETNAQFPIVDDENTMPQAMTGEAANKTILMCPSLTPLHWPGQEMSAYADEITFILPASSATYIPSSRMITSSSSSSFSASARHSSGSMVQLTCKIVDARMATLDSLLVQ